MVKEETIRAYRQLVEKDAEQRRRKRERHSAEHPAGQQRPTEDRPKQG